MKYLFYVIGFVFLMRLFILMLPFALVIGGMVLFVTAIAKSAEESHKTIVQQQRKEKPKVVPPTVREKVTIPPNDSVEGVLFWIVKVEGTARVRLQPELFNSLRRSEAYLEKLQEHNYKSNQKILSSITESLQNYDMLLHKEIMSDSVNQTLVQIEKSFYNYEKAFEAMYHNTINSELMNIDTHTDVLNQQLKSNGLLPSDFEE